MKTGNHNQQGLLATVDMKSARALILALLSFLLLACSTESRKDPAGEYWRNVMKDQPMPEAIHGLIVQNSDSSTRHSNGQKTNCHENIHDHHVNAFTKEFEPTPNISAYPDDKTTDAKSEFIGRSTGDISTKGSAMPFAEGFEPRPNISAYND